MLAQKGGISVLDGLCLARGRVNLVAVAYIEEDRHHGHTVYSIELGRI